MPRRMHPKKLLVEGSDDRRVIPELIEANGVPWGETPEEAVVYVQEFDGISNLTKPGVIETELKASGVEIVGIMADANDNSDQRWKQLRGRCLQQFPDLPDQLPWGGLIHANDEGLKLGIWLMPDNQSHGMLETFLMYLAPDENDGLVRHAEDACKEAKRIGAPYRPQHHVKARVHTWLAWQDEPGRQLHQAVKERILDPSSPHASSFVSWFRTLFEV